MKKTYSLLVSLAVLQLVHPKSAQAKELAINFDLSHETTPSRGSSHETVPSTVTDKSAATADEGAGPLLIPPPAADVPKADPDSASKPLPPPPPASEPMVVSKPLASPPSGLSNSDAIALAFELSELSQPEVATAAATPVPGRSLPTTPVEPGTVESVDHLFVGGSDSLVARAVGSAEGTRTPTGDRTSAYSGHTDPGNGVWNQGSFSYQHGAASPEEADEKQLARLNQQAKVLMQQAAAKGLQLTLEEQLNGIDLANQAPKAALDRGYINWLKQARDMGLQGEEAILWARVRSFIDPDTQRWNAPGLGNTLESISHDQERRMNQIYRAIAAFEPVNRPPATEAIAQTPPPSPKTGIDSLFEAPGLSAAVQDSQTTSIDEGGEELSWVERLLNIDL